MEELTTFDKMARRRIVGDQDTILEFSGRLQELQNEVKLYERFKGFLSQYAVEIPTLPVD